MHVLSAALAGTDRDRLERACARTGMSLREMPTAGPVELEGSLLAVFYPESGTPLITPSAVREHGAYAVQVLDRLSAVGALAGARARYSFVLASPLQADRLTSFLTYLRDVAAPPGTQVVALDDAGNLVTSVGSLPLEPAEAAVLRLLGEQDGRIVSRADLHAATGGADPLHVTAALQRHFRALGSGAHILKVPHMGYRLVGTVESAAPDTPL